MNSHRHLLAGAAIAIVLIALVPATARSQSPKVRTPVPRETPQGKLISVNAAELHGRMGLSVADIQGALDKIAKARIISVVPEGVIVPDVGKMQKYLEFLEMKERFGDT